MSMAWYVTRRVIWAGIAVFVILTVTFGLLAASPDPQASAAAIQAAQAGDDPGAAQERIAQLRGEDRPVAEQYVDFMVSMFTLEWGDSYVYNEPVLGVIADAWVYSAVVVVPSTIIAVAAGFAIGVYSATHQYTKTDYAATFVAFFGISVPNFWLAIMLVLLFGVSLEWLPVTYDTQAPFWSLEHAKSVLLPIVVLTTSAIASQMRYARAECLEYVGAAWTKTARAKGIDERRVTVRHIFRPALVPLTTILVADLAGIVFATAYVVEVIFQIPGLGLMSYNAILRGDTPMVLATTMIPAFIVIVANLLSDIAYTVLDPRISYEGEKR
ncbi:ABC transporter permease [Natrialbaceae archaeon A-gly3]